MKKESPLVQDRKTLYQTDSFEIVSIEWHNGKISPQHSHGESHCSVLIEEGTFENTLDLGLKKEVQLFTPGQVVTTPVGAQHEMRCLTAYGKTLHVYSPKLQTAASPTCFSAKQLDQIKKQISLSTTASMTELSSLLEAFKSHSVSADSPYFMNQLFSGVSPQMRMADEFITQTKASMATFEASPVFSSVENEIIDSLSDLMGWAAGQRSGIAVPGGSAANFMAVHCARQMRLPQSKKIGMAGVPLKIFVSEEAHYSFKKACVVLGLGLDQLVMVAVDDKGCMRADVLDRLLSEHKAEGAVPLLVAATAGTTVLGSFDPILALGEICQRHQVWLHVDAAWGGPALFSKKLRKFFEGIEQADSVTFDAHKLFGASLTSAFFLTKHPRILLEANDVAGGDYLFHADDVGLDRGKLSWQCGRRADALSFWTLWKSVGTEGFGDFVDRLVGLREEVVAWIKTQDRLQLIAKPDFLNICVCVLPPSKTPDPHWSKTVRERLKVKDLAFVNYSANAQGSFLRLILAHPKLRFHHVHQILTWALEEN